MMGSVCVAGLPTKFPPSRHLYCTGMFALVLDEYQPVKQANNDTPEGDSHNCACPASDVDVVLEPEAERHFRATVFIEVEFLLGIFAVRGHDASSLELVALS